LTDAGAVFLRDCQRLLDQLDQAVHTGRQVSRGEAGQLVVGFVSSATYNVLPDILYEFRQQFPQVNLTLYELTTDQQLQWMQERRLDVGFVRPPIDPDQFATLTILREPLAIALPKTHPLATNPEISLRSLSSELFILFPRSLAPGLYDQIISLCQQADFSPKVAQEAIQMQTIISLVAAGMGVAIVPLSLQNLQRTGVVYKPLKEPTPEATIAIAWRHQEASTVLQRFLDIAQRAV
jgi:DNA-binding transcriptional LysR family regulator